MISFCNGNIFDSNSQVLINPVNCVGVSGKGLAYQFKLKFPENYISYREYCNYNNLVLGDLFIFKYENNRYPEYIVNFPTKYHFKNSSKLIDIENGLITLTEKTKMFNFKSISIPKLGCGLGNLNWSSVKDLFIKEFSKEIYYDVLVSVYV